MSWTIYKSDGTIILSDTAGATGATGAPGLSQVDIQSFTSDGTWTRPSGAVLVWVICIGGGGGGGGGVRNTTGTNRASGGGGGGGAWVDAWFRGPALNCGSDRRSSSFC
jgi:hypothetical protein